MVDTHNNRIQKLAPSGAPVAQWDLDLHHPGGIALDRHGVLYIADSGNNRVIAVTRDGRQLPFSTGNIDIGRPTGIALGRSGNIYVADRTNARIVKISPQGKLLANWGSPGTGATQFAFRSQNEMNGVALDAHGNVWVADTFNNRLKELSPHGLLLAIWK